MMTKDVEVYFAEGCGRCSLGGTPQCKVHLWTAHLQELRRIVLECGLVEECKWGMPVYTYQGHNIIMVSAFKENASLSFFKGALLMDAEGLLQMPGENSQYGRLFKFTDVKEILRLEQTLKAYIFEAIEVEKAGLKIVSKPVSEMAFPEELHQQFAQLPALKTAFEALTPGRQRGYLLHFAGAKQSETRTARIEKCIPMILAGKGLQGR
jgi:uncharacterized protein YdeI (YjbR/CyaY-like superfamily)